MEQKTYRLNVYECEYPVLKYMRDRSNVFLASFCLEEFTNYKWLDDRRQYYSPIDCFVRFSVGSFIHSYMNANARNDHTTEFRTWINICNLLKLANSTITRWRFKHCTSIVNLNSESGTEKKHKKNKRWDKVKHCVSSSSHFFHSFLIFCSIQFRIGWKLTFLRALQNEIRTDPHRKPNYRLPKYHSGQSKQNRKIVEPQRWTICFKFIMLKRRGFNL